VKNGVLEKAVCKGAQVAYTLGVSQGDVAVAVGTGAPATRKTYCASFGPATGALVLKDGSDGTTYLAKDAADPTECPL
jgi:hypothetical protein